jgi:hypothetical protein
MKANAIFLLVAIGLLAPLPLAPLPVAHATVTALPLPQLWVHKDNDFIQCVVIDPPWCPSQPPHVLNCAPVPPWGRGCPHCAAHSPLASIMAIRQYRGHPGCPCSQDCLYNRNKILDGEIPNDFILQTHGVGLYDSELFSAFRDALGSMYRFSNDPNANQLIINEWVLRQLLAMGTPVLWIDRDGFPVDYMNQVAYQSMMQRGEGWVKVIAGYDDLDTYCNLADDMVMIIDPWPAAGSPYPDSPYWRPAASVLGSDSNDVFLTDDLGGVDIAESESAVATAWSNGRRLVRNPSDGSYNVVFASVGGIYFAQSREPHRSGSWTAPPLRIDDLMSIHWSSEPTLAIGPGGAATVPVLYAAWSQAPQAGGPGDIYASESRDGGRTWSMPAPVYVSAMHDSRRPSLDVDGNGTQHVAWEETGLLPGRAIYYSQRSPLTPWLPPVDVSAALGVESTQPALATSYDYAASGASLLPSRLVHIAWVESSGLMSSTVVYRYYDPLLGWVPPLSVRPEDVTGGRGGTSPSLVAGPDRVARVVWTTSQEDPGAPPQGASDVLYNERTGGVWGVPAYVSVPDDLPGAPSICPTLAIANGPFCSCLHATWEEWSPAGDRGDIWVAIRSGMTLQWGERIRVTYDGLATRCFPTLAYKWGVDFTKGYDLVWTDPSLHFNYIVRFLGTSRGVNGPSAVETAPAPEASLTLVARPNPFTSSVEFVGPTAAAGVRLEIFAVTGRRVRELVASDAARWTWDGRDAGGTALAPGVYFARIAGADTMQRVVLLR